MESGLPRAWRKKKISPEGAISRVRETPVGVPGEAGLAGRGAGVRTARRRAPPQLRGVLRPATDGRVGGTRRRGETFSMRGRFM